jgi:hypothetical protein
MELDDVHLADFDGAECEVRAVAGKLDGLLVPLRFNAEEAPD